jgi:Rrf2 family protein
MLSQTAEYALRAVVYLAQNDNRPATIKQIAGPTQVPPGYLAKVMQSRARSGLLISQRGLGGGFTLAVAPETLTIYKVIQAVDPITRITRCPLNNPAHATELCALHKRLDQAAALIEESFRNATVADMLAKPAFEIAPEPGS